MKRLSQMEEAISFYCIRVYLTRRRLILRCNTHDDAWTLERRDLNIEICLCTKEVGYLMNKRLLMKYRDQVTRCTMVDALAIHGEEDVVGLSKACAES